MKDNYFDKKYFMYKVLSILIGVIMYSCNSSDRENVILSDSENDKCVDLELLSFASDCTFVCDYNSDTLMEQEPFPGCVVDINHEGYPVVLNNLNYFIYTEGQLSECFFYRIVVSELPESYGGEVEMFRSVFLLILDETEEQIDQILIGKLHISGGELWMMQGNIENNVIAREERITWSITNGKLHNYSKRDTFRIEKTGNIAEIGLPDTTEFISTSNSYPN
jgi:hypothetical protein